MPSFGPPPIPPKIQSNVQKPKNFRDLPRYLREVVGGFFSRLFYIVKLVYEASPLTLVLMGLCCLFSGVLPVVGTYIGSELLSAIQVLLKDGVSVPDTGIGAVLNTLTTGVFRGVFTLLILYFTYMFVNRIITRVSSMVNSVAGELVCNYIRLKIMRKAKNVDLASFDRPEFYEKLENANREAGIRPISILRSTFEIVSTVISSVSFIAVLATLSPFAPILIIVCALPSGIISMKYRNMNFRFMRRSSMERRKMDYFSSMVTKRDQVKENRIMGLTDAFIGEYSANFKKYFAGIKKLVFGEGISQIVLGLLSLTVNCALFTYVAYRVVVDGAPIGDYSLYTGALTHLSGYVSTLISSTAAIYEGTLFIDNLMVYMKEEAKVVPRVNPPRVPERGKPHTVEFRHVYFRYPGAEKDTLEDICLTFSPTETVVIVGLNGAGKTTLIKLLTRLYDPTSGEILLDGVDLRDYDPKALYDMFGIIFQDFGKYAVSAADNIAFGDLSEEKTPEKIRDAAIRGNADGFIQKLPNGYDTLLSRQFEENGVDLSIGQWQKLSIARAFYKKSDIMILDEPTASLDPLAEQEVFNRFSELGKEKITVFVSHRLSSATLASLILVMENGRIVERGNHHQLMEAHGRYFELFTTQAKRYMDRGEDLWDEKPPFPPFSPPPHFKS